MAELIAVSQQAPLFLVEQSVLQVCSAPWHLPEMFREQMNSFLVVERAENPVPVQRRVKQPLPGNNHQAFRGEAEVGEAPAFDRDAVELEEGNGLFHNSLLLAEAQLCKPLMVISMAADDMALSKGADRCWIFPEHISGDVEFTGERVAREQPGKG